ncbi:MAG: hypothetical protein JRC92_07210 [Deltaproteobacteria bacterium]|nr:hypothetical protein [Deltaproteobacteria bacterium]
MEIRVTTVRGVMGLGRIKDGPLKHLPVPQEVEVLEKNYRDNINKNMHTLREELLPEHLGVNFAAVA